MATTDVIELTATTACCTPAMLRLNDTLAHSISTILKALADPTRLQILDLLSQRSGKVCVCDLEGSVGLPNAETGQRPRQATISHHLKVLRDAGLVDCEKHQQWVYYFVVPAQLDRIRQTLALFG